MPLTGWKVGQVQYLCKPLHTQGLPQHSGGEASHLRKVVPKIIQGVSKPFQEVQEVLPDLLIQLVEGIGVRAVIGIARHGCKEAPVVVSDMDVISQRP